MATYKEGADAMVAGVADDVDVGREVQQQSLQRVSKYARCS